MRYFKFTLKYINGSTANERTTGPVAEETGETRLPNTDTQLKLSCAMLCVLYSDFVIATPEHHNHVSGESGHVECVPLWLWLQITLSLSRLLCWTIRWDNGRGMERGRLKTGLRFQIHWMTRTQWLSAYGLTAAAHTQTHTHTHTPRFITFHSFLSALITMVTCLSVCLSACLMASLSPVYALLTRCLRGFTAIQAPNYNTVKMYKHTQWQPAQCHRQRSCLQHPNTDNTAASQRKVCHLFTEYNTELSQGISCVQEFCYTIDFNIEGWCSWVKCGCTCSVIISKLIHSPKM